MKLKREWLPGPAPMQVRNTYNMKNPQYLNTV